MIKFTQILCIYIVLMTCATANNLYQPGVSLTADRKASRVGDLVTVIVMQSAQASTHAGTSTDRDSSIGAGISFPNWNFDADVNTNNKNTGEGETNRGGSVRAEFTVMVTGKTKFGQLMVGGTQTILLNNEQQTIKLRALVRRDDITVDNTIPSNKLGNLHLEFVGAGDVSDAEKKNIFTKILSVFGLIGGALL